MNQKEGYITWEISQTKGWRAPGKREELGIHILGRGVLSPWDVGPSHRLFPNKLSPHHSPTFGPTLYKFIVMGPLGLDPVRHWVQSENRDPTVIIFRYF